MGLRFCRVPALEFAMHGDSRLPDFRLPHDPLDRTNAMVETRIEHAGTRCHAAA
jgi:hypothetical protein